MAKRNSSMSKQSTNKRKTPAAASTVDSVEQRVVALAEQVGRIVGTVQAKTEGWFDRKALSDQFESVRDSAAEMVKHLASAAKGSPKATRAKATDATKRSRGSVDAPGKKHRKPAPSAAGVKHSDSRIAKMKFANETRRRGPTRLQ
jgi:ElaB/YqjD/DUF883 family membrane-anchored ribosome-binding protein